MGMFDKDKEMGLMLTTWVGMREEFILWDAKVTREDFPTKLGPSPQATLTVSRLRDQGTQYEVSTLASAIVAKVREADPSDFPAVVMWMKVPSQKFADRDATVLQFVRPLRVQEDRENVGTTDPATADDDIPF